MKSASHRLAMGMLCAALCLGVAGCGSILATLNAEPIRDDPGERTFAARISDEMIETKAIVNIHAADERYDGAHLVVVSYNGFVLLTGQVQNEELKARAADVVRRIREVRRIYNELEVASPSSSMTRASDSWISAKVKATLLGRRDTEGTRVKVVTENGVVYLMGLVTRDEADRIARVAASIGGVQKVVRLFEMIDDGIA